MSNNKPTWLNFSKLNDEFKLLKVLPPEKNHLAYRENYLLNFAEGVTPKTLKPFIMNNLFGNYKAALQQAFRRKP